jgi:hypothetical protein
MRSITLLALCLLVCGLAAGQENPPAGLQVVYALTATTQKQMLSAIYAYEPASGLRSLLYRDTPEGSRLLLKMGGSDLQGVARAIPPGDVYAVMGPTTAPGGATPSDAVSRIRLGGEATKPATPERVFPLPLCFSLASAYGLWNRAPVFAVSPDATRFAVYALRVGEVRLDRPTIRLLSASGAEEWRIPLDHPDLYVADLAFSPDGGSLAYSVMPQGDEHTLDEALLPKAGVYLADIPARTTRQLYPGFVDAVAWGPRPDQITAAARVGDFWSTRYIGLVLALPLGRKVREFSLRGAVTALAYSDDGEWLAVAAHYQRAERIWIYPVSGGWGQQAKIEPQSGERIALLGWARLALQTGAESAPASP